MNKPKEIFKYYKEGKVNKISEDMVEVGEHTVRFQKKSGRTLLTCSCENHSRFCNSPTFCFHKQMVVSLPILEYYDTKIEQLLCFLEMNNTLGDVKMDLDGVMMLLKDIRRFNQVKYG